MHELHTREELEAAANSKTPTLVWYSAAWCGPCRRINATTVEVAATKAGITFAHCDVDRVSMAVHIHSISRIPTFVLFRAGNEIARISSPDTAEITAWISTHA
jgi:thioredoxin-like negative regulator of GroEL